MSGYNWHDASLSRFGKARTSSSSTAISKRIFGLTLLSVAAVALLLLSACTAGLFGRGEIQDRIGRATLNDIVAEVPEILRRNGYSIYERRRTDRRVAFVTSWQPRAPFKDESEQGVDMARTRITIVARKSGYDRYTLTIRAENEVKTIAGPSDRGSTGWYTIAATQMFKDYVRTVTMQIRLKVDAGVRIH